MSQTILILEDDPGMQSFLSTLLKKHGYPTMTFSEGMLALQYLTSEPVGLVLLDLGLDDIDGQQWLQQFRSWSETPVIVISAREREQDKVLALDNGANDYVTKPFSAAELMARVRVAFRQPTSSAGTFSFGSVTVDPVSRTVNRDGKPLHLTKIEYDILLLMLRNADKVLTHNHILSQVWGPTYTGRPEYVRVHLGQLRQKLEQNPAAPLYLKTEPGVGYRLVTRQQA